MEASSYITEDLLYIPIPNERHFKISHIQFTFLWWTQVHGSKIEYYFKMSVSVTNDFVLLQVATMRDQEGDGPESR